MKIGLLPFLPKLKPAFMPSPFQSTCHCLAVFCMLVSGNVFADWPQWRGPTGNGTADSDAKPPIVWDHETNVRWRTPLPGRGHSTPIVSGNRIFVTAAIPSGPELPPKMSGRPGAHDNLPITQSQQFVVIALNRDDGSVVWQRKVHQSVPHEGGHYSASLASASPVTDGQFVYAFFGSHGLFCLDWEGQLQWKKDFPPMHSKHGHGEGTSPALHAETLVINWDHEEESFLLALDKHTGEEKWRRPRDEVTSWSTPIIVEVNSQPQLVVCGTDRVRGYDLGTGATIWECGGMSANIVATPVASHGIVYVGSSYDKRAMLAIQLKGAEGDLTGSEHVLWSRSRGTPYVPSPLLYDGALYFLTHYQNILTRVDAESGSDAPGAIRLGEIGNIYASPVGAGGHVYVTDLQGTTQVITHSEVPRNVSVNRLGEPVNASIAIVGGDLFLRGDKHLYCIAEK
ncbi:MAG: PQQ-binding-like beta-propeller repeat protein [Rubripirellula sp.]